VKKLKKRAGKGLDRVYDTTERVKVWQSKIWSKYIRSEGEKGTHQWGKKKGRLSSSDFWELEKKSAT